MDAREEEAARLGRCSSIRKVSHPSDPSTRPIIAESGRNTRISSYNPLYFCQLLLDSECVFLRFPSELTSRLDTRQTLHRICQTSVFLGTKCFESAPLSVNCCERSFYKSRTAESDRLSVPYLSTTSSTPSIHSLQQSLSAD